MARDRSLSEINKFLYRRGNSLENSIAEMAHHRSSMDVLEVGFGYGCALMELVSQFSQTPINFYGVDKQQNPPMTCAKDLLDIAEKYDIASGEQLEQITLPSLFFYDATQLHFEDESMDMVYSAVSIRFFKDKLAFLQEVCRVLRPGGIAVLDMGGHGWDYPHTYFEGEGDQIPYPSHLVIKYKNELIPSLAYLRLFESDFDFTASDKKRFILNVLKHRSSSPNLKLNLNPAFSGPMKNFKYYKPSGKVTGGFRSLYDLKDQRYEALFDAGILNSDQIVKAKF